MLRVWANYHDSASTADDTALLAHFFNGCSDFHAQKGCLLHRFITLAKITPDINTFKSMHSDLFFAGEYQGALPSAK